MLTISNRLNLLQVHKLQMNFATANMVAPIGRTIGDLDQLSSENSLLLHILLTTHSALSNKVIGIYRKQLWPSCSISACIRFISWKIHIFPINPSCVLLKHLRKMWVIELPGRKCWMRRFQLFRWNGERLPNAVSYVLLIAKCATNKLGGKWPI